MAELHPLSRKDSISMWSKFMCDNRSPPIALSSSVSLYKCFNAFRKRCHRHCSSSSWPCDDCVCPGKWTWIPTKAIPVKNPFRRVQRRVKLFGPEMRLLPCGQFSRRRKPNSREVCGMESRTTLSDTSGGSTARKYGNKRCQKNRAWRRHFERRLCPFQGWKLP